LADAVEATVKTLVQQFRRLCEIRESARASWPIGDANTNAAAGALEGAALSSSAVRALLAYEFYKQSADPFLGGAPGEVRKPTLPGAVSPRIDLQLQPEKIESFSAALKRASAFATQQMGTVLDPLRAAVEPVASGDSRTPMEIRRNELLKKQMELASDPAREQEYFQVVSEIANLSSEGAP
jgi:hypothetical protein